MKILFFIKKKISTEKEIHQIPILQQPLPCVLPLQKKTSICHMYIPRTEIYGKVDACFILCYSPKNRL